MDQQQILQEEEQVEKKPERIDELDIIGGTIFKVISQIFGKLLRFINPPKTGDQ